MATRELSASMRGCRRIRLTPSSFWLCLHPRRGHFIACNVGLLSFSAFSSSDRSGVATRSESGAIRLYPNLPRLADSLSIGLRGWLYGR